VNEITVEIKPNEATGRFNIVCSDPDCSPGEALTVEQAVEQKLWHLNWHATKEKPWVS